MERVFDRVVQFDDKSRSFPVRSVLPTKKMRSYTWQCDRFNDQGTEGACVGFAWGHELSAIPFKAPMSAGDSKQIYYDAREFFDPWPGEAYQGTSVLAGCKAVQKWGYMREYRWGFGLEDVTRSVGSLGPGVAGINWYSMMNNTDINGFIHKGGFIQGGHAIMVRGVRVILLPGLKDRTNFANVDKINSYFILHNSWGESWGMKGLCKISFLDFEALLHEAGEFVIPTIRTK
jgi:hypothetical protein